MEADKSHQHAVLYTFLIALALVSLSFLLQANIGLNLADEGYIWYGTIRTAGGEIPIKDFHSYDPGRYYWTAAWSLIFGQGFMALRLSTALFQVIGLTLGLLAARRIVKNWCVLSVVGLLLLVWMHNIHHWARLFESSIAMAGVFMAVRLIEKPVLKRYFYSGVFVGLAAFMGRNHGVYSFLAFFLLILFIWFKLRQDRLLKRYGLWLAGIIVGYTPMLFLLIFIPSMFETYLFVNVLSVLRHGSTNLRLPVPWPWTFDYAHLDILTAASNHFLGLSFLLLPIFYISVITWLFLSKSSDVRSHSLLIAASFVGIFYMHHAFSRADLPHLEESIHPFLLGFVALLYTFILQHHKSFTVILVVLMFTATVFAAIIPANPYIQKIRFKEQFIQYSINGDRLWLPKDQAAYIETIKQLVAQHVAPHEGLFIAPHSPGLYPILHRRAPVPYTYLLFQATKDRQEEIIEDLIKHKVNWVILADIPLDGRDELRFRHTYPLVWQYIMRNFEPIETPQLPSNQQFLRRKLSL